MRLGLVIYGSLETLSGGYLYDRELVAYLRQQGDTVKIISLPWQNYALHLKHNISRELRQELQSLNVDLLLQDELNHPSLFLINEWLKDRVRYPVISIVHHLRSSENHPAGLVLLYRMVERRYLVSVQGFVFNSRTTCQAVSELRGKSASGVVAYPGGDRFGAGLSEAEILKRLHKPGPLRLLFVGNLIPRKGLHIALAALHPLKPKDWTFQVVGRQDVDPAYTRYVMKQVEKYGLADRVHFRGELSEEALRAEWMQSHILMMPSQYEGFGIVYLEGMSFGLPALASSVGAAGEIIKDGENGFLIPPGDAQALSDRLAVLIADRGRLVDMSLAARRRYDTFPTWQQSAQKIRDYLTACIETSGR